MLRLFRILLCITLVFGLAYSSHAANWWMETGPAKTLSAEQIIDAGDWTITNGSGQPIIPAMETVGGREVLVSGEDGLRLTGPPVGPESELTIRFSMNPPYGEKAELTANVIECPLSVTTMGGSGTLTCGFAGGAHALQLRSVYQRSLNWPDNLRKLLDHEMTSQQRLQDRWLTLRFVMTRGTSRFYVNDILLDTLTATDGRCNRLPLDAFRLTLSPGVQLVSVSSRSLSPQTVFEPVRIDSRLNAFKINDSYIPKASLPPSGASVKVNGVPFVFPEKDRRGNDHIDVGVSWMQYGYMEGDYPPEDGWLGGRWAGPRMENPRRIQFQIPKGRYNALHVICAADSDKDQVPVLTAQFFTAGIGRPESFSTRVPLLTAKSSNAVGLPVMLGNGKHGNLYLITIPIDPGALAVFDEKTVFDIEITKEVEYYRCYPDPCEFSAHAAGLPSSVHVYAMTLEKPAISVRLSPGLPGNVWVAPDAPVYDVNLLNTTEKPRRLQFKLETSDYYHRERTSKNMSVELGPGVDFKQSISLNLKRYGYHDVTLTVNDGGKIWTERRSLAYLHPDTRERGDWEPGRGPIFGCWAATFHGYPPLEEQFRVMSAAGVEAVVAALPEPDKLIESMKMTSFMLANGDIWVTNDLLNYLDKPEEVEDFLLRSFKGNIGQPSAYSKPELFCFFAEPGLGPITTGIPPDYYGEDYKLSQSEQERLDNYAKAFMLGAPVIKKHWPHAKLLLPWGDPIFPIYFLRAKEEIRSLVSGVGVDIPAFERLAENQMHQLSIHRCYAMREDFRKAGIKDPIFAMMEGPAVSAHPSSLSLKEHADNSVRLHLLLYAHGIDRLIGGWGYECNDYYGEQHYGSGGDFNRTPLDTPRPNYSAKAAMTRHLNRKNLQKWLHTGSLSVYALQFKHYRTGALTQVFWTVRGRRPVTLTVTVPSVTLYDQMDNATVLQAKNGKITFTIDQSPCYIEGLTVEPKITLGKPDHSDARPAPPTCKTTQPRTWSLSTFPLMNPSERPPVPKVSSHIGNLGDGTWKMSKSADKTYANNSYLMVARFPGNMSIKTVKAQGKPVLAVHLGKQKKERKVMPFYTTLLPPKPVVIPGKASHIGLWVHASSDWGRVVYSLRDAEGERWISIGAKNDWNCDDTRSDSFFCFDGWRYLRFELPNNSPYDQYRELGTTWWGHYGGDGLVQLPLKLEKIIAERRTHAMYVNDPQPARPDDVLLGDLYAEYEQPEDRSQEAVRLNRLRIPIPKGMPDLGNPIVDLEKSGVLPPTDITRITLPSQDADGTKCFIHFQTKLEARSYDVWVSSYPDGRGAMKLGNGWTSSGQLITGLRQDTDFYVFLVYTDKDGRQSKPSKPLKIRLQDMFGMK